MEIDIEKILKSTNLHKVSGIHDLLGRFLKDGSRLLSKPISELFNCFSDSCKSAKLKPLFKKRAKINSSYYRAISLLTLIFKVIEKHIHEQTISLFI